MKGPALKFLFKPWKLSFNPDVLVSLLLYCHVDKRKHKKLKSAKNIFAFF